jgi:peptidoglycan/LPS O-acetylase OafA/YrhL
MRPNFFDTQDCSSYTPPVKKHFAQKNITSEDGEAVSSPFKSNPSNADTVSDDHSSFPDYFTRHTSQILKAIAIFLVVFGHFYTDCIGGTEIISDTAEWGVLVFLIVSGMGLTKSYGLNSCGKQYIQRRLHKIIFAFWLSLAFFYILDFFLLHKTYPWHEIALSLIGIMEMAPPDVPLWFIPFISLSIWGFFYYFKYSRIIAL